MYYSFCPLGFIANMFMYRASQKWSTFMSSLSGRHLDKKDLYWYWRDGGGSSRHRALLQLYNISVPLWRRLVVKQAPECCTRIHRSYCRTVPFLSDVTSVPRHVITASTFLKRNTLWQTCSSTLSFLL